jgi:SAM-dependent methyltransferase
MSLMGPVMTGELEGDWAVQAFEAMAPDYDDFTAHYEYEFWIAQLLEILERDGLTGKRLLDAGCGTGRSFLPLLARDWKVTGYDISASMLNRARQKASEQVRLEVADMRAMPRFGEFDLVWALDDAINYLLSPEELLHALIGLRNNLAPTGLLLFDVNELSVYRALAAESIEVERGGYRLIWRGAAGAESPAEPGSTHEFSCIVEKGPAEDGRKPEGRRRRSVHRQRHFSETEIRTAIDHADLECLSVYGQGTDGIPCQPLNDAVHTKAIYVARAI